MEVTIAIINSGLLKNEVEQPDRKFIVIFPNGRMELPQIHTAKEVNHYAPQ
jgi:hypothetical protein